MFTKFDAQKHIEEDLRFEEYEWRKQTEEENAELSKTCSWCGYFHNVPPYLNLARCHFCHNVFVSKLDEIDQIGEV